ncbi:unnamed protein product [Urochloa humidicola]
MAGVMELFFFFFFFLCVGSYAVVSPGGSNSTDELALLSFKSMLSSSPSSLLASWNVSSHFCSWPGVVCGRRHPDRVVALHLNSFNLSGHISPFLSNMSFLKELDLGNNQLGGLIPREIGKMGRLQLLNFSKNQLEGSIPVTLGGCAELKTLHLSDNHLQGDIPHEVGTLKNLIYLKLSRNGLSGEIPRSLGDLKSIKYLLLCGNRLSGEIPSFWGNLTNLSYLCLAANMLTGAIPSSMGTLSRLSWIDIGRNNLTGLIPTSLWNISSLSVVAVQYNMLTGTIPHNAFNNVPHLQVLYMDHNQFHGPIPASIANASAMMRLQLSRNSFNGIIPPEVGRLRNLSVLQLFRTLLQAKEPKDWQFLTALTNCSQLQMLTLSNCKFEGVLPDSISNLSASLSHLVLAGNRISGSVPEDIGNLINLQTLELDRNIFTGSLPSSLSKLQNLVMFFVYNNNLSGLIPQNIGNLTGLAYLGLDANEFSGTIPSTIGNLTAVTDLRLSNNYLTGPIPNTIFNIPALSSILDLSNNNLEGALPQEIGNLKNLLEFYAEFNSLSGQIPTTIGECQLLEYLSLRSNKLEGSIPLLLSQLRGLEAIDLSSNNLSGQIPKSLGNLTVLYFLNLSFNKFVGEVPNYGVFANITGISIQGNSKLCGGIPDLHLPTCSLQSPKRKHKSLVLLIVISLVTTLLALTIVFKLLFWRKKRKRKSMSTHSVQSHPMISYLQLVRATDGFSTTNLLGSGSSGSVYKGELNGLDGGSIQKTLVAVKVLKIHTPEALKSFTSECEALRNMRHRNLVKIVTICSSIDSSGTDFKAIVYDFMPNGSLEGWLHPDTKFQTEQRYLNLSERVTILLDVAHALDYLHCHGTMPVVHCDLKSGNILLDTDMVAHVGDFGLAKILAEGTSSLQQSTSSMGFRGTIGYAAPEYGVGNMVSTHGDIYSYGILILETVTAKRPTDSRFSKGSSLREYVDQALQSRVMDAVDKSLVVDIENELQTMGDSSYKTKVECIVSLLKLGMSCTQELPSSRMPAGGIIKGLHDIKEMLLATLQTPARSHLWRSKS